ncbi:MAG: P-loop NTPase fold protein [Geitlerinemataceae cyanobacterium]
MGKHTQTESQAIEAELEVSGTASAGIGLEGILKFLAAIKGKLKANSVVREEITTEFARKISDLIDKINEIQAYIQSATKQEVLVIIDDLDKLDLSIVDRVFHSNIQPLLQPSFRIIYTIPITTLREVALKRNIEAYVDKIHTMRVAKFFSKTAVRKLDRQPNAELMEIFGEILAKRLPNSLIDLEVKPQMILKSGGVLREFIRIADRSCNQCMTELRRQIRRQEFDKPLVKIDRRILDTVLTDLQLEYAEPLGQKDYDLLVQLYREMKPQDAENQRFLDLFHGLYVLEYRNAQLWYDLNPIVADLLRQEDSLDDIAP